MTDQQKINKLNDLEEINVRIGGCFGDPVLS